MGDEVDVELGLLFDRVDTIVSVERLDDKVIIGLENASQRAEIPSKILDLPVEIEIIGKVRAL
jgi:hypothetical protein